MGGVSLVPERYPPPRFRVAPSSPVPPGRTSPVPTSRTRESGTRQLFTRFVALMFVLSAVMTQNPLQSANAVVNAALQFDGTNDYVTFGAAPSLGLATFTLEAWIKR